tara:strand:+ start:980 stop:1897 length:918 start_codon:yes stop_codon:yes gene_type:complete
MLKVAKPHLLVVGGTGFIGFHLLRSAKKRGWKVSSVSLNKPKKNRHIFGVNYLKIDITNLKKLKKKLKGNFTYIVNLGGYVNHTFSYKKKQSIIQAHYIGLINLTKIFSKKKIKKFVQIGSSAEYGKIKAPQNENYNCLPDSPYAKAKLASSEFLLMLYKVLNFPVTILRFFQVYGPHQDQNRVIPQIIKGCLEDKKFPTSKGGQLRDFCYVDDVINAIFLTLKSKKVEGEIINIGSGKPIKIRSVVNLIRQIIKKGKPQFGKVKYRKDENMKVYSNIKKAKIMLNWKPTFTLHKGIKNVINFSR